MTATGKKLYIKTYGCQMNVYDSGRMADALAPSGYRLTDSPEHADLIILNTCHIREKAAEKVYSELGRLRLLKEARRRAGAETRIALAGCVAQAEGAEVLHRARDVDFVLGPQSYHLLPRLVREGTEGGRVETGFPAAAKFDHLPPPDRERLAAAGVSAFLTVQEGCDKFCAFCVVPYTRGAEISRPLADILTEARRLTEAGIREITLIGQNVNAWHGTRDDGTEGRLGDLLAALAELDGVKRLRYTTSHPLDMDDGLIAAHRDLDKLMPYLHLPVQSGSDRILTAMNRRHRVADYLRLVERVRAARPDIAISGDFIVGFPGETEADFQATLDLVEAIGYAQAYSFKFSARPGTPAAEAGDHVAEAVKAERLARLQEALTRSQRAFNAACRGRILDVLFERPGRRNGQLTGRSPYLQPVHAELPADRIGDVVAVEIVDIGPNSLFAVPEDDRGRGVADVRKGERKNGGAGAVPPLAEPMP